MYTHLRAQKSLFSDHRNLPSAFHVSLLSHQGWGNGGDTQEGGELPQDPAYGSKADPPRQALGPAKP